MAARRKPRNPRGHGVRLVVTDELRALVSSLVSADLTHDQIAELVVHPETKRPIDPKTLRKYFARELAVGKTRRKALIVDSLYKRALNMDHPQGAACAMFIMKCQYGWRQEDRHVHAVDGDGPVFGVLVAPAGVAPADWVGEQERKNALRRPPRKRDAG